MIVFILPSPSSVLVERMSRKLSKWDKNNSLTTNETLLIKRKNCTCIHLFAIFKNAVLVYKYTVVYKYIMLIQSLKISGFYVLSKKEKKGERAEGRREGRKEG